MMSDNRGPQHLVIGKILPLEGTHVSEAEMFRPLPAGTILSNRLPNTWIPVTEKVPGQSPVLIYTAAQTYDIAVCQIKYTGAGRPCWERGIYKEFYPPDTVTHWMPLPPPPEPQP